MTGRFFRLTDDLHLLGRWHLRTPVDAQGQEVNPWPFTKGYALQLATRPRLPLRVDGRPLDFTLGGLDIPVVHARVAAIFSALAPNDVQLIPVDIDGQTDPFHILVATRLVMCIDEEACEEARPWREEDGRPEKVGQYRVMVGMRIDPSKVGDAKVFRTWGWSVALIISEDIKQALEREAITGTSFREV